MKKFLFLVVVLSSSFSFADQEFAEPQLEFSLGEMRDSKVAVSNVELTEMEKMFFDTIKVLVDADWFGRDGGYSFDVEITGRTQFLPGHQFSCESRVEYLKLNTGSKVAFVKCGDWQVSVWGSSVNTNWYRYELLNFDFYRSDSTKIFSYSHVVANNSNTENLILEGPVKIGDQKICDIPPTGISLGHNQWGPIVGVKTQCAGYVVSTYGKYNKCDSGGYYYINLDYYKPGTKEQVMSIKHGINDHCHSRVYP